MEKIIVCDIDGILVDYPKCYIDWVNEMFKTNYSTILEMKKSGNYIIYKSTYRVSGCKRTLNIKDGILDRYNELSDNYKFYFMTTRPDAFPVNVDTTTWIYKTFGSDKVIFTKDKLKDIKSLENVYCIVDDDRELTQRLKKIGYKVYEDFASIP